VSTSQADEPPYRIPSEHARDGILPVVGVWGANASGKTNLLKALLTMREAVRNSFRLEPGAPIPWEPFAQRADTGPTRHELEFELQGTRYRYGFEHTAASFTEEWLYTMPEARWQCVFHRGKSPEQPWVFGRNFSGARASMVEQTRSNALFLSTAAQLNHESLAGLFSALLYGIQPASRVEFDGFPVFGPAAPIVDESRKLQFEALLRALDLGCTGLQVTRLQQELPAEMLEMLRPEFVEKLRPVQPKDVFHVQLLRTTLDGQTWTLPSELESAGTNMMLRRINDLIAQRPGLLVMDELDVSLHPDLTSAVVALYTSPTANAAGRQLLFTAHDRELMNSLRRDEVLLVDKDRDGVSTVHATSDYRGVRRDRQRLTDLYSAGQFGGTPILGSLEALMATR
jgi:hypothetical protein